MKQKIAKQLTMYRMELDEINSNGSLPCPSCGAHISPDDQTEEIYTLLDVNMNGAGLEEIVVRCNRCQSQIYINGFSKAEKLVSAKKRSRRVD
jgi:DNA-directed RNA polymerase subunit RPC12/RpoP